MIDITDIFVKEAKTSTEKEQVFNIRWKGYKKYFTRKAEISDDFDIAPNVTLLLAFDKEEHVIGTMRILDRTHGRIELDRFVDVDAMLSPKEQPCAEATRFSIPTHPKSRLVKFALWKAYYRYCLGHDIQTMLIWVRACAARDYRRLLFDDVGIDGQFTHPSLGNVAHYTYKLYIPTAPEKFRAHNHALHNFFCEMPHRNIQI